MQERLLRANRPSSEDLPSHRGLGKSACKRWVKANTLQPLCPGKRYPVWPLCMDACLLAEPGARFEGFSTALHTNVDSDTLVPREWIHYPAKPSQPPYEPLARREEYSSSCSKAIPCQFWRKGHIPQCVLLAVRDHQFRLESWHAERG